MALKKLSQNQSKNLSIFFQVILLLYHVQDHKRRSVASKQASEGVKSMTIVNASDIFGKFFEVSFFILENVITQIPLSIIYQTRAAFFWSTRYTQRKINTC